MSTFPLVIFCVSTLITPGPNNIILLHSGIKHGFQRSLGTLSGIILGFSLMVLCVGLCIGSLMDKVSTINMLLKPAGTAYLLYLSYQIFTDRELMRVKKHKLLASSEQLFFSGLTLKHG